MNTRTFITKYRWITIKEINKVIISSEFSKQENKNNQKFLRNVEEKIINFLDGKKVKWNFEIKQEGTKLQQKIWKEISKMHHSETNSYKDIALILNTSPRIVGTTCGKNKILLIIPCHRVLRSDGKLCGYSAPEGIKLKKEILKQENILFSN